MMAFGRAGKYVILSGSAESSRPESDSALPLRMTWPNEFVKFSSSQSSLKFMVC